jgi:hypothetical protein
MDPWYRPSSLVFLKGAGPYCTWTVRKRNRDKAVRSLMVLKYHRRALLILKAS